MKQSQLSLMLVLAIALLVVVAFLLFLRSSITSPLAPDDPKNVELYVTQALTAGTIHCLNALGLSGGSYRNVPAALNTGFGRVAYAGTSQEGTARWETSLEDCVEDALGVCVDGFKEFSKLGMEVSAGQPAATASLSELETGVAIDFPVAVQKEAVRTEFDRFAAAIPVRLHHLIRISEGVTEAHSSYPIAGSFDLTHLGSLDVNTSLYQYGDGHLYEFMDGQSRLGSRSYTLLAPLR